jgi:hypothetical protein
MRGDILQVKRRIGFADPGRVESFLVVQSDVFADDERVAVMPIDDARYHVGSPLAVPINSREVALVDYLAVVSREKFGPEVARQVANLERVDRVLGVFLAI